MMTVGAGRFADGGARCDEREMVVCCSQPRPGKAEGERAGDGLLLKQGLSRALTDASSLPLTEMGETLRRRGACQFSAAGSNPGGSLRLADAATAAALRMNRVEAAIKSRAFQTLAVSPTAGLKSEE